MMQKKESFYDRLFLLNGDDFRLYNITVAKFLQDIHASIMISELISSRKYYASQEGLFSDEKHGEGWFYRTQEKIEERTCLTRKNQDHSNKILIDIGWIEKIVIGLPAKRYFKINDDKILSDLNFSNNHSSLSVLDKLDCPKGTNLIVQNGQTAQYREENNKEKGLSCVDGGESLFFKSSQREIPVGKASIEMIYSELQKENFSKDEIAEALKIFKEQDKPIKPTALIKYLTQIIFTIRSKFQQTNKHKEKDYARQPRKQQECTGTTIRWGDTVLKIEPKEKQEE
jgi:hypothetical protein